MTKTAWGETRTNTETKPGQTTVKQEEYEILNFESERMLQMGIERGEK